MRSGGANYRGEDKFVTHDACNRPHQGTPRWFGTFSCKISIVESEEERIQSIGS